MASILPRYPTDQFQKKWIRVFFGVLLFHALAMIGWGERQEKMVSKPPPEVFQIQMQHVVLAPPTPSPPQRITKRKPVSKAISQTQPQPIPEAPVVDESIDETIDTEPDERGGAPEVSSTRELGVPPDSLNAIKSRYLAKLRRYVESVKSYPRLAHRLKQQGRVTVRFVIEKNGAIRQVEIKEKCPFAVLNQAAQESVGKLQPFDPIPEVLAMDQWEIELPIVYSLQ